MRVSLCVFVCVRVGVSPCVRVSMCVWVYVYVFVVNYANVYRPKRERNVITCCDE